MGTTTRYRGNTEWVNALRKSRGLQPVEEHIPSTSDEDSGLGEDTAQAWEIFTVLNRTRVTNETGPQPITVQEFSSYCSLFDITDTGIVDDLFYYVTELDKEWLKVTHAKIQNEREKAREKARRR